MVAGVHYAEFTLLKKGDRGTFVGAVEAGFGVEGAAAIIVTPRSSSGSWHRGPGWLAARQSWLLATASGTLWHAGRLPLPAATLQFGEIKQGDAVGLLLDLGQRTLSLYLNGSRRGVMVAPGMKNSIGETVGELSSPLRWAVGVGWGASVRIEPPAEVAAAVARNAANCESEESESEESESESESEELEPEPELESEESAEVAAAVARNAANCESEESESDDDDYWSRVCWAALDRLECPD
jgi:hypothetical protein